jgi:hypothetical protein
MTDALKTDSRSQDGRPSAFGMDHGSPSTFHTMSTTKDELQAEVYRLEDENKTLRELGAELRKSAEMIGYVQCADDWRNAERRIKAWDTFLANTADQRRSPE